MTWLQFAFVATFVLCVHSQYKVCVYPPQTSQCTAISRGNSKVECVLVQDSVDCALKIQNGQVDFGSFYPEQLHLVSHFINEDSAIIGEIKEEHAANKNHSYQTVVLVKKGHQNGLQGMKGKTYCSLGFKYESKLNSRARKEFEYRVLPESNEKCSKDVSLIEKEVSDLSKIFTKACRPGPWTRDSELDSKLKNKYSNLCSLCNGATCDSPNVNPSQDALICLNNNNADVGYVIAEDLDAFIIENPAINSSYDLLCQDGQTREIIPSNYNDCAWRNQPWAMIVGRRDKVQELQINVNKWIEPQYNLRPSISPGTGDREPWTNALRIVLGTNDESRFLITSQLKTPQQTLIDQNQNMIIHGNTDGCVMRWCTISTDEDDKCQWLSKASINFGIKPLIKCIPGDGVYDCMTKIQESNADIMSIDSHYGYLARKKTLRTLLNVEEFKSDLSRIYAIIKNDREDIKTFADLKNKIACFPEYRGLEWLAFIQQARETKAIPDDCDYGKSISNFFDGACAPGVASPFHARSLATDQSKLCSVCKAKDSDNGYCGADYNNKYYGNNGSLTCLLDGAGDVAFVEINENIDVETLTLLENTKVICKDESLIDSRSINKNCALIITVNSEVVSKPSNEGNYNFKRALLDMDYRFGGEPSLERTMQIFDDFNGQGNLLFKNNTIGLVGDSTSNEYVQNYKKLFESVDKCTSGSNIVSMSSVLIISAVIAKILF